MVNNKTLDRIYHALSDTTRREFITQLTDKPKRISDLKPSTEMSKVAISKHIHVMASAMLVTIQKKGRESWVTLDSDTLTTAQKWVADMNEFWINRLDKLELFLEDKKEKKK